jgi:prepilin-type N-terminal cleavage/methylation domain-containing protein
MQSSLDKKTAQALSVIRKHSGFTLMELMIVVFIIGVLAAVAVPLYQSQINKAKVTVAVSILDSIGKALEDYEFNYHKYPANIDFTTCFDDEGHRVFLSGLCNQIKNELTDPIESYSVNGASYALTARAMDDKRTLLKLANGKIVK